MKPSIRYNYYLIMMLEKLFNRLFSPEEREKIRSRSRKEPTESERKAWILFAYMNDFRLHDIARSTSRNIRQARYLLSKAEDLFSVNDREIHRYIDKYERTLEESGRTDTEIN